MDSRRAGSQRVSSRADSRRTGDDHPNTLQQNQETWVTGVACDIPAIGSGQIRFYIQTEQALPLAHDRIVLRFPFYWYSAPPVMVAWMDQVLSFSFANGPGGDQLKGREFLILVSTGGPEHGMPHGRL
ncbi:NAD(P)H-dependent oxidoreductase [Ruegeria arenilitoris]|uniref:NAD(P)H-dependent oxidoreductase n=1 Tax=Ruegeria arenilitoris TaxID=1173585 RepID=UPI002670AAF9|nr:NAD(P)H-dependent oxidoreductase [Ruegeria arenilitoris]